MVNRQRHSLRPLLLTCAALLAATAMGLSLRASPPRVETPPAIPENSSLPTDAGRLAEQQAPESPLARPAGISDATGAWMTLPMDAGLPPMARVKIHVIDGAGLRIQMHEEAGDASARSPVLYTTQTDGTGTAELIVPVGVYQIALGDSPLEGSEARLDVPAEGLEKTWTLHVPGALAGRIVDAQGRGIANAVVRSQSSPLHAESSVVSAEDGTFTAQIPPGIYAVEVSAPQYALVRRDGIQIRSGAIRRESFTLAPLDAVLVLRTRCDDSPCDRANIQVEWMGGSRNVRTNPEGVATLASLPRSEVEVRAIWNAGQADERRLQTFLSLDARRQERTLQLELVPEGTLP